MEIVFITQITAMAQLTREARLECMSNGMTEQKAVTKSGNSVLRAKRNQKGSKLT